MTEPGLNKSCIGKTYTSEAVVATAALMESFARVVGDVNGHYVDLEREGGIVAHPVFPVRLLRSLMPGVLADEELGCDMLRLVHGEQTFTYLQPLRAGDVVELEGTILGIEDKHSGQILRAEQTLLVGGQVAVRGLAVVFIRGSGPLPPRPPALPRRRLPFREEGTELVFAQIAEIGDDQADRYAQASGDFNPIHLYAEAAAEAGLPGIILQGTCTLAFAARALVTVLDGDPARLQSLSVRFSKPVMIPDRVTIEVWRPEPGALHFEARNKAGDTVLSRGIAEVREGQ